MSKKNETENEDELNPEIAAEIPILPVDDLVVFPYMPPVPPFAPHHIALSGDWVTKAVDDAMVNGERALCVFRQVGNRESDPKVVEDFAPVGTLIQILRYKKDDESVLRCPRISASSCVPPSEIRTNFRPMARATDLPSDVFPTPGGPTKQRIGPFISCLSIRTARYSKIRSLIFSRL